MEEYVLSVEESYWVLVRLVQRIYFLEIGSPVELSAIFKPKPCMRTGLDKKIKMKLDDPTDQEDKF